jgi:hypothetical protein
LKADIRPINDLRGCTHGKIFPDRQIDPIRRLLQLSVICAGPARERLISARHQMNFIEMTPDLHPHPAGARPVPPPDDLPKIHYTHPAPAKQESGDAVPLLERLTMLTWDAAAPG